VLSVAGIKGMKFSVLLPLLALAVSIEVAGIQSTSYAAPQEGQYAACDNSGAKDTKTRAHTCECARAKQECDPNDPDSKMDKEMEPGSMCKAGYCKPDHCECQSKSCS
jgi:hypothetical protein